MNHRQLISQRFLLRALARPGIAVIIVLGMFILTALASAGLAAPQERLAAKTPTRTLTPTPTRSFPISRLRRQLVFSIGGGPGGFCYGFRPENVPAIEYQRSSWNGADAICLASFPEGRVTIKIYDPNNRLAVSVPFYIQDVLPLSKEGYDRTLNAVHFIPLTYQAPAGWWRVTVEGDGVWAESSFPHPDGEVVHNLSRALSASRAWYDSRRTTFLKVGDHLVVDGYTRERNADIPIAIYRLTSEGLRDPLAAQLARTNGSGYFSAGFAITSQFNPGEYYVLVNPNPDVDTVGYLVQNSFMVVRPNQACPNAMPSLIQKDRLAVVSAGMPNNVREKPGLNSRLLGKLNEYEEVKITAGPKCADGLVWWKVYSLNTGLDGWTAEGQGGDYWLNSIKLLTRFY